MTNRNDSISPLGWVVVEYINPLGGCVEMTDIVVLPRKDIVIKILFLAIF